MDPDYDDRGRGSGYQTLKGSQRPSFSLELHPIGFVNVLVKVRRLDPLLLSAPQHPPIMVQSMASLDLINNPSSVGASYWIEARTYPLLIALAWNRMFSLKLLTDGSFDTCEL